MKKGLLKSNPIDGKTFVARVKKNWFNAIVAILVAWVLFTFLIYPNINIVLEAFQKDGKFSFYAVEQILNSKRAMKGLGNSFLLAFTLSITVNIVGIFIVLVSEYFDIKGAKLLNAGYMTTFIYGGMPESFEDGKIYRNMFHYNNGFLVQGRIYPQGNDGATDLYKKSYRMAEKTELELFGFTDILHYLK